jgi:heat shock protein HslJ
MPASPSFRLALAGCAIVTACAANGSDAPPPLAELVGTSWRAVTIDGQPVAGGVSSTLTFLADGRVAGSGGCNRYAGEMRSREGRLQLGPLASTMMACPPERMEQEQRFLTAVGGTERVRRDGAFLVLDGPEGTQPTRLTPFTEADAPFG